MAYVKITSGSVETFPYSVGQLRKDNPSVSFPRQISDDTLAAYGVYPASYEARPSCDESTQSVSQNTEPTLINGAWIVGHEIANKTAAEIADYIENNAKTQRTDRNKLLAETDWTQVADAPVDQAVWATYRQALRNITAQAGFPNNITWPTKPE